MCATHLEAFCGFPILHAWERERDWDCSVVDHRSPFFTDDDAISPDANVEFNELIPGQKYMIGMLRKEYGVLPSSKRIKTKNEWSFDSIQSGVLPSEGSSLAYSLDEWYGRGRDMVIWDHLLSLSRLPCSALFSISLELRGMDYAHKKGKFSDALTQRKHL